MMDGHNYAPGDRVYIIANTISVKEMEIMSVQGDFCTLRDLERYGAIRLWKNRLFATREEAEQALIENKRREYKNTPRTVGRDPHWL